MRITKAAGNWSESEAFSPGASSIESIMISCMASSNSPSVKAMPELHTTWREYSANDRSSGS
jgi:hypothetical protein